MTDTIIDLDRFDISEDRGFLPKQDPLRDLPKEFASLQSAVEELPDRLASHAWGPAFEAIEIPQVDLSTLTKDQLEAVFRDFSFATAAWIWEFWQDNNPRTSIPKNVAVPFVACANVLRRPPILAYPSYGPRNWYRYDLQGPIGFNNTGLIRKFYGGLDESGFILPHVEIEAYAGAAVVAAIRAQEAVMKGDIQQCERELTKLAQSLQKVVITLKRIPDCCEKDIYNKRVRAFIFGIFGHDLFKDNGGLIYEGVAEFGGKPQKPRGETGAQSVIFHLLDWALGVIHDEASKLSKHLRQMRSYMPVEHRELLGIVEDRMKVRGFVADHKELIDVFDACLLLMIEFRQQHYKFARDYIFNQSNTQGALANPSHLGTGGTDFNESLAQHVQDTQRTLIRVEH